jgi:type II secretory pathway pseudopilin PulG
MLVVMTIASIFLAVAAGEWAFVMRRERERELIFRGVQIARAVDEWGNDPGRGGAPTSLEVMTKPPRPVLRKVYADPMTARYGDDGKLVEGTGEWVFITQDTGSQGGSGVPGASGTSGASAPSPTGATTSRRGTIRDSKAPHLVPILGVQSSSDELSIGSYQGGAPESPYSDWKFRSFGINTNLQTVGGYEVPRPPGFGGLRLPGGLPLRQLGQPPGGQPPGGQPPPGTGGRGRGRSR